MRRLVALALAIVLLAVGIAGAGLVTGAWWPGTRPAGDLARASADAFPSPAASSSPAGSPPPAGSPSPSVPPSVPPSASPSASPSPRPPPSPAPRPLPTAALQAALQAWRAETGTPGVSVTIRWPDGRAWTGVSGVADARHGTPMTADTAFPLASISKTFTAALILRLVDEGRLGLDEPVAPRLPGLGLDPRITVRMLLDHTSGLPDVFSAAGIDRALQAAPDRIWTVADSLAFTSKGRATPGTVWVYSNTGYLLLGQLVRQVTGRTYAVELRQRFFDPLGLDTAFVQVDERPRGPLAVGHLVSGAAPDWVASVVREGPIQPFASVITAGGAADAVAASSPDLARWAEALYGGSVLSGRSLARMIGDASRISKLEPRVPYGLGVQEVRVGRWLTYGHSGHLLGFRDVVRWLPSERVAIAILTDHDRSDLDPLVSRLLEIALPAPLPCTRCQ